MLYVVFIDYHGDWRAYVNKLKKTDDMCISCFHKLSQIASQVLMPISKLK